MVMLLKTSVDGLLDKLHVMQGEMDRGFDLLTCQIANLANQNDALLEALRGSHPGASAAAASTSPRSSTPWQPPQQASPAVARTDQRAGASEALLPLTDDDANDGWTWSHEEHKWVKQRWD